MVTKMAKIFSRKSTPENEIPHLEKNIFNNIRFL
jgi:hypothetical protein